MNDLPVMWVVYPPPLNYVYCKFHPHFHFIKPIARNPQYSEIHMRSIYSLTPSCQALYPSIPPISTR